MLEIIAEINAGVLTGVSNVGESTLLFDMADGSTFYVHTKNKYLVGTNVDSPKDVRMDSLVTEIKCALQSDRMVGTGMPYTWKTVLHIHFLGVHFEFSWITPHDPDSVPGKYYVGLVRSNMVCDDYKISPCDL